MSIREEIGRVLKTPVGSDALAPEIGFEALEPDGSTKLGISEQVLAEMARAALTRSVPGVVFNDVIAHRDAAGQLMKIEVEFMDEVHDPASQSVCIDSWAELGFPVGDRQRVGGSYRDSCTGTRAGVEARVIGVVPKSAPVQ